MRVSSVIWWVLFIELSGDVEESLAHAKDLICQLYTQMHLSEWHASREKELQQSIESIKHELAPYDQVMKSKVRNRWCMNRGIIRLRR